MTTTNTSTAFTPPHPTRTQWSNLFVETLSAKGHALKGQVARGHDEL